MFWFHYFIVTTNKKEIFNRDIIIILIMSLFRHPTRSSKKSFILLEDALSDIKEVTHKLYGEKEITSNPLHQWLIFIIKNTKQMRILIDRAISWQEDILKDTEGVDNLFLRLTRLNEMMGDDRSKISKFKKQKEALIAKSGKKVNTQFFDREISDTEKYLDGMNKRKEIVVTEIKEKLLQMDISHIDDYIKNRNELNPLIGRIVQLEKEITLGITKMKLQLHQIEEEFNVEKSIIEITVFLKEFHQKYLEKDYSVNKFKVNSTKVNKVFTAIFFKESKITKVVQDVKKLFAEADLIDQWEATYQQIVEDFQYLNKVENNLQIIKKLVENLKNSKNNDEAKKIEDEIKHYVQTMSFSLSRLEYNMSKLKAVLDYLDDLYQRISAYLGKAIHYEQGILTSLRGQDELVTTRITFLKEAQEEAVAEKRIAQS